MSEWPWTWVRTSERLPGEPGYWNLMMIGVNIGVSEAEFMCKWLVWTHDYYGRDANRRARN